ncbi:MAG: hypothetical protein F4143_13635 [Gemmatimonadales bacterium]|nr:hypothetical protein [Gemmatimonadales bacterium]
MVAALHEGSFEHETRDALGEKNLLAVGDVHASEVAALVLKARSEDYRASPHHWDQSVVVHTFTSAVHGERWYIKVYFIEIDRDDRKAMFISVHRAGG